MIIKIQGDNLNADCIRNVFYIYENSKHLVKICYYPGDTNVYEFPTKNEAMECIDDKILPAMNVWDDKMEKKIRKLKKRLDEVEAALKYMSGSEEYRKAYKEFMALQHVSN